MLLDFNYQDIVDQCNTMVYLNVLSFCALSGCGNIDLPQDDDLNNIYSMIADTEEEKKPRNIFFMSSLYKQCTPIYMHIPENPYDFTEFQWIHKKTKKTIKPAIMAYSIYCLSKLAKKLKNDELKVENKNFIYYCLLSNALKQACFSRQYLKIGDLFYSGEDIGENSYGEYHIELNPEDVDLLSQFLMIEAYSELLNNEDLKNYTSENTLKGLESEYKLLPTLCQNVISNINMMKSRHLSVICLSLLNTYDNISVHKNVVYDTLNIIGCELNERLYDTGDIARNIIDRESSSFITLCNCLSCFVKLYEINNLDIYKYSIDKLYDRIDSFWNDNLGLFIKLDDKRALYSIKDVSYVLSALRAMRSNLTDPELFTYVEKQLAAFYRSSIVNSKVFSNQIYPILQENKFELHNLGVMNRNVPPIFLKDFEIKLNKKKYYCKVDIFRPEYILCGCKNLL